MVSLFNWIGKFFIYQALVLIQALKEKKIFSGLNCYRSLSFRQRVINLVKSGKLAKLAGLQQGFARGPACMI